MTPTARNRVYLSKSGAYGGVKVVLAACEHQPAKKALGEMMKNQRRYITIFDEFHKLGVFAL